MSVSAHGFDFRFQPIAVLQICIDNMNHTQLVNLGLHELTIELESRAVLRSHGCQGNILLNLLYMARRVI